MAAEQQSAAELRPRLGKYGVDTRKERAVIAERFGGEAPEAVFYAMFSRRAWIGAASRNELVLVRRPRLMPARDEVFRWAELEAISSSPLSVELRFAGRPVTLTAVSPESEAARLLAAARRHAAKGEEIAEPDEIRALARRKLGRMAAFGWEPAIDALPDRLAPGERVERLATGALDFDGLLVLTDRRLLLFNVGFRAGSDRLWEVERAAVEDAEATAEGLRLSIDGGPVVVGTIHPERALELAAVLARRDGELTPGP